MAPPPAVSSVNASMEVSGGFQEVNDKHLLRLYLSCSVESEHSSQTSSARSDWLNSTQEYQISTGMKEGLHRTRRDLQMYPQISEEKPLLELLSMTKLANSSQV